MAWDQTYTHTIALAVDRLGAALIFNRADITISSLCWVVRSGSQKQVATLKLSGVQTKLLRWIGDALEYFWPGHCARARQGDITTSAQTWDLLMESNGNPG